MFLKPLGYIITHALPEAILCNSASIDASSSHCHLHFPKKYSCLSNHSQYIFVCFRPLMGVYQDHSFGAGVACLLELIHFTTSMTSSNTRHAFPIAKQGRIMLQRAGPNPHPYRHASGGSRPLRTLKNIPKSVAFAPATIISYHRNNASEAGDGDMASIFNMQGIGSLVPTTPVGLVGPVV